MKKFLALALASVMAVSLVACGSTHADTNAGNTKNGNENEITPF